MKKDIELLKGGGFVGYEVYMKDVIQQEVKKMYMHTKPTNNSEEEANRELQVIVGGLDTEEDEEKIVKQIRGILDQVYMFGKVDKVFASSDPTKIAVIEFKTKAAKIGFFKKVNTLEVEWENGNRMWFKGNEPIQKRIRNKTLGYIKHQLINKGCAKGDVKINWPDGVVKLKGKKVAEVSPEAVINATEEETEVVDAVSRLIREWKGIRGLE